jgi:hypothetical protein
MSRPVHEVDLNHTRHSIGNHAEKVFLLLFSRGMRAHSHSARIVSPFCVQTRTTGAATHTAESARHTRHALPARRRGTTPRRVAHHTCDRSEVENSAVVTFMGDFRGVSDRAYPAALNTSHAAMRHLMRHGGLGGGRRLRFAGHPGTAPCGMDPNVSKPARCRQWRSARAYRRITAERHVRTTAPPVHPGRTADVPATNVQSSGSPSSVYTNTTELHAHSWIGSRRRAQALTAWQQRRDRYAL